ncbi:MAG: hypothetical protein LBR30_00460 [Clostridioides sp.]|jgi:hypothetical protein|nr:hypothetical protein [Clostridioides sp.]
MELDFTRFNELFKQDSTQEQDEKPSEIQSEQFEDSEEYKTTIEQQNSLQGDLDGLEGIRKLQLEIDTSAKIYKEYQDNMKLSGQLQTEILKGAKNGESVYILLLKACKVISLMTSNNLFYSQLEGDIRAVYGDGLLQEQPLREKLADVEEQQMKKDIKNMTTREAEIFCSDPDNWIEVLRRIKKQNEEKKQLQEEIEILKKTLSFYLRN